MKLSVIIATRNETERLAITLRSLIEELQPVKSWEVIIADNSDNEFWTPVQIKEGITNTAIESVIPLRYIREKKVKLLRQKFPCLFTARELAAKEAQGKYIYCVDAHGITGHNQLRDLVDFMDKAPENIGFAHAPINWLCQHEGAARHDMQSMLGNWGRLYDKEVTINWKGMPWICKRDWFLNDFGAYGCLSEHKTCWGGGDLYLGLKSWLLGYENWAVPTRPWIHIGPFPIAIRKYTQPYKLYGKSGNGKAGIGFIMALCALDGEWLIQTDYFKRFFTSKYEGADIPVLLAEAIPLAERDRKWIKKRAVRSLKDMERKPPWQTDDYTEFQKARSKYLTTFAECQRSIKEEDWPVIHGLLEEYNVRTCIEFGAGISTLLLEKSGVNIISFETDQDYIDKFRPLTKNGNVFVWDNRALAIRNDEKFDLGIVDGAEPRLRQAEIVKALCRIAVVHDGRPRQCGHEAAKMFNDWTELPNKTRLTRVFVR